MDLPISELMDESACYGNLVEGLHPDGFAWTHCPKGDCMTVHRRRCPSVLDFHCGHFRRVFNSFTGAALHGVN